LSGQGDEAEPVLIEAIRRGEALFPQGDPALYMAVNSMILLEWAHRGNWAAAAGWYDRLIELGDRMPGEYAQQGVAMRLQVAGFYAQAGDMQAAAARLEEFLARSSDPGYTLDWQSATRIEMSMGWLEGILEARPDLGRGVQLARVIAAGHIMTGVTTPPASMVEQAGAWLAGHGFDEDAAGVLEESVEAYRSLEPPNPAGLRRALGLLGGVRVRLGAFESAEPALREALSLAEGDDAAEAEVLELRLTLAECLIGRGRVEEARRMLAALAGEAAGSAGLADRHRRLVERAGGASGG
jgi:tetratricopeptide (TPR) repeat protein